MTCRRLSRIQRTEDDQDDAAADVANVSEACLSSVEHMNVDPLEFNRIIVGHAADSAFVLPMTSTWDTELKADAELMHCRLPSDEKSFGHCVGYGQYWRLGDFCS